jgi:Flp pilus assembly protein TadG
MTVLVLIWMIAMLVVSGLAIDFTRAEHMRVKVQNTLDRAILAASDIDQPLDPRSVVLDYFAKAGMSAYISADDIHVTGDPGTRRAVSATARAEVKTTLMAFQGLQYIAAPAAAGAVEERTDIEVALVLDVSNSMNSNNRLPRLKEAAAEFIDLVLSNENARGDIAISLVPYTGQVNASTEILSNYTVSGNHTLGNCVNFPQAWFSDTTLATSRVLPRADVFDPWHTTQSIVMYYCSMLPQNKIIVASTNADLLKGRINGLIAEGNTSIDIGMKWGAALLDPSFRPVMSNLIAGGHVDSRFQGLPANYDKPDTRKYVIVMSDGENTDEFWLRSAYASGNSSVWRNGSNQISVYHTDPNGDGNTSDAAYWRYNAGTTAGGSWASTPYSGSTRLTWPQVWASYPVRWVAAELYGRPLKWTTTQRNNFINAVFQTGVGWSAKDTRTNAICNAVKAQGLVVYSIAFEAGARGQAALQDCASTATGHYFSVTGMEINEVFRTIARRISELKLTQ